MTEQIKDTITINQYEYQTYSFPLESWIGEKITKSLLSEYSNYVRGYRAHWGIINNQLILNEVSAGVNLPPRTIATWFSGVVLIPGDIFSHPELIYPAEFSLNEGLTPAKVNTKFIFKEGILVNSEVIPSDFKLNKKWWQIF